MEAYRRYGPAVLRKCQRLLQNRADAEDVTQSLFLELLRRGEEQPELPYLFRAATNRCLNLIRDRDRRRRLLENRDAELRGPVRTTIDEQVIHLELLTRLVDSLDERSAEILVLHCFDDLSQSEIGELLGISRRAVVKRLGRVRQALESLAGSCEGGAA